MAVEASGWIVVFSKRPKIGLKEFLIGPKFEFRLRLTCVYRMSKDGVYLPSVPSCLSGGCRVRSSPFQIQFLGSRWPIVSLGWFVVM